MTTAPYDGLLPLRGERSTRSSRAAEWRALPRAPRRPDPASLVETLRLVDPALALGALLLQLGLAAAAASGEPLRATLQAPVAPPVVLALAAFTVWWSLAFVSLGLYGPHPRSRVGDEAVAVAVAAAVGVAPLLLLIGLFPLPLRWPHGIAVWLAVATAASSARLVLRWLWRVVDRARPARRLLVVGSGPRARALIAELRRGHDAVRVVGHVDCAEPTANLPVPFLGNLDDLEPVLMRTAVDAVLIALPVKSCYAEVQRTIEVCERIGVVAQYPADVFRSTRGAPRLDAGGGRPVVALSAVHDDCWRRVKRAVDVAGAALGLLLLWPLMLALAAAIALTSRGPVLFVQRRCGRNRRVFWMYKFRTMVWNAEALQPALEHLNEAPGPVFKILRDPRITPLGRFLRRTSLDELPQLVNVLRGDMSLVGPRPLPLRDVHRFSAAASLRRFSVRPGMTCLWQVNGRSRVPFDDWVDLDLQYIDRWSLLLDMRILLRTVPAVLRGEGAA